MAFAGALKTRKALFPGCDFGAFTGDLRLYGVVDDGGHDGLHEGPSEVTREGVFQTMSAGLGVDQPLKVAAVLRDAERQFGDRASLGAHVVRDPRRHPFAAVRGNCGFSYREPQGLTPHVGTREAGADT